MPACEATAPSSATAGPDPRATASARRRSANKRVAGGVRRRVDETHGSFRQPGAAQRRHERVLDDRSRRGECVGADSEHDRVAGAHHPAGVGEDVRAPLEHESDDAERRASRLDRPAVVVDALDGAVAPTRRVAPAAETVDHVAAHTVVEHQPGGRTVPACGCRDVGGVRFGDRPEPLVVRERCGEALEEVRDLIVARPGQLGECAARIGHGVLDESVRRLPGSGAARRSTAPRSGGHRRRTVQRVRPARPRRDRHRTGSPALR